MKVIRIADGKIFRSPMEGGPGQYQNYWGPKLPGETDVVPTIKDHDPQPTMMAFGRGKKEPAPIQTVEKCITFDEVREAIAPAGQWSPFSNVWIPQAAPEHAPDDDGVVEIPTEEFEVGGAGKLVLDRPGAISHCGDSVGIGLEVSWGRRGFGFTGGVLDEAEAARLHRHLGEWLKAFHEKGGRAAAVRRMEEMRAAAWAEAEKEDE